MKCFCNKLWCFGALAPFIFVVYFVIPSFVSTNNSSKHSDVFPKQFLCPSFSSKRTSERKIYTQYLTNSEAAVRRYSTKQMFLKLRKIHKKTPLLESLFNKVTGFIKNFIKSSLNFIKKRLQHRYFPVNFAQFFKNPCLQNTFK